MLHKDYSAEVVRVCCRKAVVEERYYYHCTEYMVIVEWETAFAALNRRESSYWDWDWGES
jgi:hypothetical protein